MAELRDWAIVAPWWKWSDPTSKASGRVSRPVFQKYDTPNLVNTFLKNPQHCLAYVDDDFVHTLQPAKPHEPPGGKKRTFSDQEYVKDPSNTRKIFLDTHKRFYLVVCEIHCDEPGFPNTGREHICQVGFVIRRRTVDVPSEGAKEVNGIIQALNVSRARLAVINELTTAKESNATLMEAGKIASLTKKRASVQAVLAADKSRFADWAARFGVAPKLQGWIKSTVGADNVGAWQDIDETPIDVGDEVTFPMYPLIAPANDPNHPGKFGTLYFGLLPTGSAEIDAHGRARFDDQQLYEVRVFAKRHDAAHTRASPCKCPDKTFWSVPTEVYRLASHFDLVGTSQRPVTIQLPALDELAAQAKPTLGVALAKPPGSIMATGDASGKIIAGPSNPSAEICSFAIPLITIVATFVFQLFLPIVTLLFGLFFLLKLKFCFPPEVKLAASITAEFDLDMSALAEANISADIDQNIIDSFPDANFPGLATNLNQQYSRIANGNMLLEVKQAGNPATAPSVTASLVWEPEVQHT